MNHTALTNSNLFVMSGTYFVLAYDGGWFQFWLVNSCTWFFFRNVAVLKYCILFDILLGHFASVLRIHLLNILVFRYANKYRLPYQYNLNYEWTFLSYLTFNFQVLLWTSGFNCPFPRIDGCQWTFTFNCCLSFCYPGFYIHAGFCSNYWTFWG